jgi:ubiquinone/menaquinone biosynthesis methyltransferase
MLARRVVLKEKFLQRFTLGGRFLNTTQTRAEQIEKKEAEITDKLFKYVAPVYDHLNDATYLGFHRNWRNKCIRHVAPSENTKLIDVAGGTGAIPIRFLDYVKKNNIPNCHVTVCDINEDMLKMGKRKSVNYDPDLITWIVADGQSLPFDDETFNAYTISFGLRCCSNMDKMLNEAFRILQPGGKFFCLEFSTPDNKIARWLVFANCRYLLKVTLQGVMVYTVLIIYL